jgi:hypothetical protein
MKKNIVLSKKEKDTLSLMCLPIIKKYLIKKNKNQIHIIDAIECINRIEKNETIYYKDAFFILFSTVIEFEHLKNKTLKGELDFSQLKDPEFWKPQNITLEIAIFFVSTYYNELFSDNILDDFKTLSTIENIEKYVDFRNELLLRK